MTDREFVIAFVLARAGAINGKCDYYDLLYDAEAALVKINNKFPPPAAVPAGYVVPNLSSYDEIPF